MNPLELVRLPELMKRGQGRADVLLALVDGPVFLNHPDLVGATIREIPGKKAGCTRASATVCTHATFVAGILSARRGSGAPAICPGCTLLVRPIFAEATSGNGLMPTTAPEDLAQAIADSVDAGARVINLSCALLHPWLGGDSRLGEALDYAQKRGAITVAAAGNQGTVGSSAITGHAWVTTVAATDPKGRPLSESNLGRLMGQRGLSAPGQDISSLGTNGKPQILSGTSAAAPFVTGTIALLWSEFPNASAAQIKLALARSARQARRRSIVPPLLDAWAAYQVLSGMLWQ
jgi:subtilisin family serine protease